MESMNRLIGRYRGQIKERARLSRYILVLAIMATLTCFVVFVSTLSGKYPLPMGADLLSDNPERLLGATNFFMMTAVGAALNMWRFRQMRIKLMIAEAFIRENDNDTAMKLLLEPVFGDQVWQDNQNKAPKGRIRVRIPR
ncbi:hypothetical protein D1227_04755 [Henriciella mobilis]|uniref:Uncharacterized protein n=2 Tax=Henriciella mobilis TaxID=2305467 RepID=A0A399RFE8_9PROT|nr:hypothetical protein D1227_04755 [Henriciella mobilis]RIJ29373.1 hypothetical protein D1223_09680 [Henriciella mobilis]